MAHRHSSRPLFPGLAGCALLPGLVLLAACGQTTAPAAETALHVEVTGVHLDVDSTMQMGATLEEGGWVSIWPPQNAFAWGTRKPVAWTSSDPGVVMVQGTGLMSAVAPGVARVEARYGDAVDTALVVVEPAPGGVELVFSAITAGAFHTCALEPDGAGWCWGEDWHGELGDGRVRPYTAVLSPVPVAGGLRFSAIDAGARHTCGVAEGRAFCWGSNMNGQIGSGRAGPGAMDSVPVPVAVEDVAAVAAGGNHSCALTAAGVVACWGGGFGPTPTPVPVPALVSITAGYAHSCGVTAEGTAYCWGENDFGQLGTGTTEPSATPVAVTGDVVFSSLTAGNGHTCGVAETGAAYCWGSNGYGKLGTGGLPGTGTPTPVAGSTSFARAAAGADHTCALAVDGRALCWGSDWLGQVGDGHFTGNGRSVLSPVPVDATVTLTAIAAGAEHSCALDAAGTAYCWGSNLVGGLGTGSWAYLGDTQLRVEPRPRAVARVF